jgi:plastocyanin
MTINNVIELEAVALSEDNNNGQGQGPPDHAGGQGPPDHAGEQGPPDHAPAHGRQRRDEEDETEYAWVGVSPEEIEGEISPTLSLAEGEEYIVEWTNSTEVEHNFVISDEDGNTLLESEGTNEDGATETVEFTADEEMFEYFCDHHPEDMWGEIDVTEDDEDDEEEVLWHRDHEWEADAEEATDWDNYAVQDLGSEASGELMAIDVDPQGRIWYIGRGADFVTHGDDVAEVCYVDPDSGEHQVALELDVLVGAEGLSQLPEGAEAIARELGGQSVAIDPNFEDNGYVYVNYHPASDDLEEHPNPYHEDINSFYQLVSRFEMDGDVLDPDSEEVIIEIPFQADTCCHYGSYMEFDPEGNLYISTGDDSNNVGAPHRPEIDYFMGDERDGHVADRPAALSDAQRTSGNTADFRGSILRVTPTEDGYEIPDGNLKEWWEEETGETYDEEEFLPELYVMGLRNPFTFSIDEHTGFLFVGDYGNDAPEWDEDHGTVGQATYHLFDEPGNAGHPFFKGYYPNRYRDFELEEPGQPFWFDNLRNRSPNNTGIENIPNVTPALLWHPQSFDTYEDAAPWADMPRPGEITWPQLDEGGSADAGVTYRYSDDFGEGALDPYFEDKQFFMNPSNADVIRYLTFNEDGSLDIEEFLPDSDIASAYDMDVLPDGRLVIMGMYSGVHVVEYGDGPDDDDDDDDDDLPGDVIEPGTAIELDGQTGGWIGIAPEEIDGEENPTLALAEGEEYELGWTTGDGSSHNIEIRNEDGDIVDDLSTEMTSDPGDDQWLQFEATSEMAEYVCAPHEGPMSGDIDVQ